MKLSDYLEDFVTERRLNRIEEVLRNRTRRIVVVLEDLYQSHNASAVLRSCECFGVQDVYVIENYNSFEPSSDVALGSSKWLTVHHYNAEDGANTRRCLQELKDFGYRIAATCLSSDADVLSNVSVQEPLALCFGNEENGLSATAMELADMIITIPIHGFTQSFNISVSAALCLYELIGRLHHENSEWGLTEEAKKELRFDWLKKSVQHSEKIIERYSEQCQDSAK